MKKILYAISVFAALALAGCQKEEEKTSSVQLTPETAVGEFLAGTTETTVISSGEWDLDGHYTWITPSAERGKPGDKITFTYSVNTSGKERAALFKIRCGTSYSNFAFKQESGVIELTATLEKVSVESGEYKFKMNVVSPKDIGKFVSWGLRYSTDVQTLMESGTDVAIDGTPKEGDVEVTVNGLPNDYTYYFVGYLTMSDGSRVYTDNEVEVFVASAFESEVTVNNIKARQATFSYEIKIPALVETGICLESSESSLTYDDGLVFVYQTDGDIAIGQKVEINPLTVKLKSDDDTEEGWVLDPDTEYFVRAYAKRPDGEIVYGPTAKFTTKSDPWNNLILDDNFKNDYDHFQSLCEFGPIKDGKWGASQYVTEAASDKQKDFRKYWNTALTSYSTTSNYAALFNELAFLKNGSDIVMQNIVWREGSVGENDPKEANRVGGFAYKVTARNGFFSFQPDNFAFVPEDSWAVQKQGMQYSEIMDVYEGASNQTDFRSIKSYWSSGYFFLDWGDTKTFDGQTYTDILLYLDKGLHSEVFRFNAACFGTSKYDVEPHSAKVTWTLYVGDGTSESYELSELETGGYYLRLNQSLAGKTVRISKSSGGYPAYIPTGDGKYKVVNSASAGTYTVPVADDNASKCAISFSQGENICIVKDIALLSDTCFPCGDQINWGGSVGNWDAGGAYRYCQSNGGFFAPTDKLHEPHIYRFNVTFKTGGNEGFKIPQTNNFTKGGYNSKVMAANPVNTWCDVVIEVGDSSTGAKDYKWKPDVNGDYTIELDLNAMKLRAIAR